MNENEQGLGRRAGNEEKGTEQSNSVLNGSTTAGVLPKHQQKFAMQT
jgi:hypothetical protein